MAKTRESNIELLRIISMLMIIAGHLTTWGIMKVDDIDAYVSWAAGSQVNRIFTSLLIPGGDVGVGVFFLITGYFLIGSEKVRSVRKIVEPTLFYSCISFLVSGAWMLAAKSLSFDVLKSFAPFGSSLWWFISAYLLLVMLSPAINHMVRDISENQYWLMIFCLWVVWYVFGKAAGFTYYPLLRAVWFYLIGGVIAKYQKKASGSLLASAFIITWIAYGAATYVACSLMAAGADGLISNAARLTRSVFFSPIASVALFLLFLNIQVHYSEKINSLAALTIGIYLFHEMPVMRSIIWGTIFQIERMYQYKWFPLYAVIVPIIVFVVGAVIETIRLQVNKKARKIKDDKSKLFA